jgi:hypothetical protein
MENQEKSLEIKEKSLGNHGQEWEIIGKKHGKILGHQYQNHPTLW